VLCIALAATSLCVFAAMSGRPSEANVLRRLVVAITIAKAAAIAALYAALPDASFGSDAAVHYLPQTLRWLSGHVPYRDFASSYSPLFHVLLMPAVLIWPKPVSVVVTIFALEVVLIALYAHRSLASQPVQTWRVLFLYSWSPISFYWIALTGYNSGVIALFALIALRLAEARRDTWAGIAALLGLAFSKLTVIVAWPAIVFFPRGSAVRRMAPLLALSALLPALLWLRIDLLYSALHGRYFATTGNVWFLVSELLSARVESAPIKLASMASLLLAEAVLVALYLRGERRSEPNAFDRASALYSACALVFMIFAYKTFPWYLTMCLIFVVHTLVFASRASVMELIPFALLGALTTLEPALSVGLAPVIEPRWHGLVVAVDLVMIACVAYYAWQCARIAVAPRASAGSPTP
jgi:hypothetical protein